jgi:phosphatidylglycerol:prolipoprotein diacylglycerol transferase
MFLFNHSGIKPLNPIAFNLFGLEVHWYGVLIGLGASLALALGLHNSKKLGINRDKLIDGFLYGVIIGILGARLWYVIFEWGQFKDYLPSILGFQRNGAFNLSGLGIHGAVITASVFAFFFCKKNKISFYKMFEILAPGFLIGQVFGRWGNFFNQEAHGGIVPGATLDAQRQWLSFLPDFITNQMYITDISNVAPEIGYYHPTFLYESLWNLIGFGIILLMRKFVKKYWIGDAALFYLVWYGIGRYFIEGLRTDSLMVGPFRTAQITSLLMIVGGVVLFILRRKFKLYPLNYMDFVAEAE